MSIYEAAIRQNARRRQNSRLGTRKSSRISLPPALTGLDTRAPINQLGSTAAYELVNLIPDAGALRTREGSGVVIGYVYPITRVLTYSYLGSDSLGFVSGVPGSYGLYFHRTIIPPFVPDITLAVQRPDLSATMFNGYLIMVNGADHPFAFYRAAGIGHILTLALTGTTTTLLHGVKAFKNRLYFWGDDFGFWYLATNAIQGPLVYFPLDTVAQSGGAITSINSWTQDGGNGSDDFLVITTSKGEVIVYQGSDPSDPNDWALVGRYQIGRPLSQRGFLELDGKILVLTETDLEVLPDKFKRQQVSTRISTALRENLSAYGQVGGYRLFYDSVNDRVLASIPTGLYTTDELVRTAAGYTRFSGINSSDYTIMDGQTYVASGNYIYRQGGTIDRKNHSSMANIAFSAKTGYAMLNRGSEMRIAAYRPKLRSKGSIQVTTALSFDQSGRYLPTQTQTMSNYGVPWGSPWNSLWSEGGSDRQDWLIGCGTGQSVSMSLSGSSKAGVEWCGTDYELVPGGMY